MAPVKKLSTYLNGYYSYFKIKDAKSEHILEITFDFIKDAKRKIYKQPSIALREIKVELIDIHIHHERLVKELEQYVRKLEAILSKSAHLDEADLKKVGELEEKRNILAEFVYSIEEAISYMTRMLLEHYSELDNDKLFIDKFAKFLGPFDWMSKRVEHFITKNGDAPHTTFFKAEIIKESRRLIEGLEVSQALDLLLSNVQNQALKKQLILLKHQWVDLEKSRNLGILDDESIRVTRNKIVWGLLSII